MKPIKATLLLLAALTLVLGVFSSQAFSANLSLQATTDGFTEADEFLRGDAIYLNIVVDDSTGLAGCAFTVTYDASLLEPPATDANGVAVDGSVTSVFPFTFQSEEMHRENASESGKVYLAGATIDETTGGAKAGQTDAVLFTLIFKLKNDAPIGSTFNFGLEQTRLMNPAAGYGTDVNGNGIYEPGDGDTKDPVTVLVGAVAQGAEGYDNFDCNAGPCAFPEIASNLPVTGPELEVVPTPTYAVSGTVAYTGPQTGNILVGVFTSATPGAGTFVAGTSIPGPGAFTIPSVTQGAGYYLAAFRDSDGGSDLSGPAPVLDIDPAEAQGMLAAPFDVFGNIAGKAITLTDPDLNADGIPDYWANRYPGIGDAGGDFDQDGYSNLVEFQNQTDPTVADAPFGPGYNPATDGRGPYQRVAASPESIRNAAGKSFSLAVNYTTTDGAPNLSGLGLRIHYDSTKLTWDGFSNAFPLGLTTVGTEAQDDGTDADNDPSTDKYVVIAWSDSNSLWPGSLPKTLFNIQFTLDAALADGETTTIRFSATSTAASHSFFAGSATVTVSPFSLDVDGNGVADALTDGLLIMRYLFESTGDDLIFNAVDPSGNRTTAADIENYLAGGLAVIDIDGNGVADALTDGLLIMRYLFESTGDDLIFNAVDPSGSRTTAQDIESYILSIMP
mgnify:CR=1 FL=1